MTIRNLLAEVAALPLLIVILMVTCLAAVCWQKTGE